MTKRQFFFRYGKDQFGKLLLLLFVTLASTGLNLYLPQLIRRFLNQAKDEGSSVTHLIQTAAFYMVAAFLIQGFQLLSTYLGELIAWLSTNKLREDLARHCIRLDMSFHKSHKPGELVARVDNDVNETRGFFSTLFVSILSNIPLFVGVLFFLFREGWIIGLTAAVLAVLIILCLSWINKKCAPHMENVRQAHADLSGDLQEWVQGREDIQASSAVGYMLVRLMNRYRKRFQASMNLISWNTFRFLLSISFPLFCYTLAYIWVGGGFGETIPIVSLIVVLKYIDKLQQPIMTINQDFMSIAISQAAFSRITKLLSVESRLKEGDQELSGSDSYSIEFDDVSFGYEDSYVIKNVSFSLTDGQHLGLLGHTGCGKTTLTRLLLHLYDVDEGQIRLKNSSGEYLLHQVKQSSINKHFAMVTQEVELFNTTLRNNLTMFNHEIQEERIIDALKKVSMDNWLATLPKGLDTPMNGSEGLSAGEAQLISLARIFLKDPGLVILDEASSRLDPETERKMELALKTLLNNRTAIIIAHRLETIMNVDRIVILEKGSVIEDGNREELIQEPTSRFSKLLNQGIEEALV